MKSSSFYSRKAAICRELGHWKAAGEWAAKAAKARKTEKRNREIIAQKMQIAKEAFSG